MSKDGHYQRRKKKSLENPPASPFRLASHETPICYLSLLRKGLTFLRLLGATAALPDRFPTNCQNGTKEVGGYSHRLP